MEEKQMQRVNEAAQKFAEAVRESLETMSNRSAEAQEQSRQLTQSFFDSVVGELQRQTESNREASQELIEQSRKQQEAFQQLTEESMAAYRNFLGSMFSYYQAGAEQMRRGTTER